MQKMEMRAKDAIVKGHDITPPLSPLAFSLHDSFLSSHCSSCSLPLSTTPTTTSSLHYCSVCTSSSATSLHFSSAEHHLFSLLHSHPSLFPHSSTTDLRLALRLLHRLPSRTLSSRFFGLLTNRDALLSDHDNFSRVRVGARVMAMAQAMRDEREFEAESSGFELEEAFLCLVITNAVEVNINGERLGFAVYDWRFSWNNHSCYPNSCFRFVPSSVVSETRDYSSSSLRIFACGDAGKVDGRGDCGGTCELAEGVRNYGPNLIVRSIKDIQRGEEVTITYTDLLQPMGLRQSELFMEYKFFCDCKRCSAVPQAYVDHALQETFCVELYNSISKTFDSHSMEEAVERLTDLFDSITAEYMDVFDPILCCEKVEELISKGVSNQHMHIKLSPLHALSLKAYTVLMSTYKIRADMCTGETHLSSFDMIRISAAYSFLLACATHHLFQSEPSLIASATTFWVDAGKSLLCLARHPSWNSLANGELQNVKAVFKVNCPRCSLMSKFESSFSPTTSKQIEFLDGVVQEFHKCLLIVTPKIWRLLVRGCKYLEDVRDPIDFGWVWAKGNSGIATVDPDDLRLCNEGKNGGFDISVSSNESIEVREDVFLLGIHCVLFGAYFSSICYGNSCSTHLVHNLLQI